MEFRQGRCFLGRCLIIDSGKVELAITLDVGPRIISLSKKGGKNIFFNDLDNQVCKDVSRFFGANQSWHIYGGHRIWVSPEGEQTYVPDNGKVEYTVANNQAVFTPQPWPKRNIAVKLAIQVVEDNLFKIKMYAKNIGTKPMVFGLWGLTVCCNGGELQILLPALDTGYLPNRNIVLWSYTDLLDSRLTLSNNKLTVRGSYLAASPLKVGTFNKEIYCSFRLNDTIFIKEAIAQEGIFPDMNCNIETYTNDLFHEIETLSPFKEVLPQEEIMLSENWRVL